MGEDRVAHITVLAEEVCAALRPVLDGPDGIDAPTGPEARSVGPARVLVDATAGLGGHTLALLAATHPSRTILFDRDPHALARARLRLADAPGPIDFVHAGFDTLAESLARLDVHEVAAVVADLGVSSMQLDEPERGFSFRGDGPLDMRMDPSQGLTAAELLAQLDAGRLSRILRDYGEEPEASRIAAAVVKARPTTTRGLADVVTAATSGHQRRKLAGRIHPATRTFMALRIAVNDELGQLDRFLAVAPSLLRVGGRLAVITFHSLEDRRVKRSFRALCQPARPPAHLPMLERDLPRPGFTTPQGYAGGVTSGPAELENNPRARSARLRVLERCAP